jgi:hypothetical protein
VTLANRVKEQLRRYEKTPIQAIAPSLLRPEFGRSPSFGVCSLGAMLRGFMAIGTALAALALFGCGSSSSSSSTASGPTTAKTTPTSSGTGSAAATPPPGTPAALRGVHGGTLLAGDLSGFVPQRYRAPSTSAQSWVAEYPPEQRAPEAARLKALGFIAGITEQLAPAHGGAGEAISTVEQFRSAHGANGDIATQVTQALARGESAFAVAGIPGARGFGSSTDADVAFAVGAYYYLVGFESATATRTQLIAAAQSLYRRVRG